MSYDDEEWGAEGDIQAAIKRCVESGDLDSLAQMMNQPWARTKNGEALLADAIKRAKDKALKDRVQREHRKLSDDIANSASWT